MYVDDHTYTLKGKTYRRTLLRHSYREGGKTKQKNIANISNCTEEEITAIKYALKNKDNIDFLQQISKSETVYWKKSGASILLYQVIKQLGMDKILGRDAHAKYILWQVMARLISPCSRLATVRLAEQHCGCELIGIDEIDEQALYDSLVWLHDNQDTVEKKIFKRQQKKDESSYSTLFLYDVSSSYLEGKRNELADWGYNRDKKKGKLQIVYGLLTNSEGYPLSVEVFRGNTGDTATVGKQIEKIKEKFGCKQVVFVGDKGMIKQVEIDSLQSEGMHYLTTITKPQIESLIKKEVFQLELFTREMVEVIDKENSLRYVLRKNDFRAEQMAETRAEKMVSLEKKIEKSNLYLNEHPRAKPSVQERNLKAFLAKLKMTGYVLLFCSEEERKLTIEVDKETLDEISKLDGCYAMKTDLIDKNGISKEKLHDNYKALAHVEWAFRTQKSQLKIRPVYLRKAHRTKGHLMVCMLAYMIEKHLREKWKDLDITVMEGVQKLDSIVGLKTNIGNKKEVIWIGKPDAQAKELLDKAEVVLPSYLPAKETDVTTKKKLQSRRK